MPPNQVAQRTGASRFAQRQIQLIGGWLPFADLCVRPVKPSVTVDFLRGILSAYAAYSCYFFSDLFWFIVSAVPSA